jgi:hypothetical protein
MCQGAVNKHRSDGVDILPSASSDRSGDLITHLKAAMAGRAHPYEEH